MPAEILKYKEFKKVTYYVLHVEGRGLHEFEDFQVRMNQIERYRTELQKMITLISEIGENHGALVEFFRNERAAEALPQPWYHYLDVNEGGAEEYGLRLYCLRLTPDVVLLLNGDMKIAHKADDCPNCGKHFKFANQVAKAINKDIEDGTLSIYGKDIEMDDDYILNL
ncbi:MAG: hypothetical protein V4649_00990 [Bacteroidota bacterium]